MKKKLSIMMAMIFLIAQLTTMGGVYAAEEENYQITNDDWLSKVDFAEGLHSLGEGNKGMVDIEFDFIPLDNSKDSNIGYADSSTIVNGWKRLSMIIAYELGEDVKFIVRNGSSYRYEQPVSVINNKQYHFRIEANLNAKTYNVYVTPEDGVETAIAVNYAFRTDAPAMDDVGQLAMQSEVDDAFVIKNHYVNKWLSKVNFAEGLHNLGETNMGDVKIEFDFMPLDNRKDSNIGYADSSTAVDGWKKLSMIIAYEMGEDDVKFIARNGSAYRYDETVSVENYKQYHIRIEANLGSKTYSVYVTPKGGIETAIATDYKFRTDAPAMDDVGQLAMQSEVDDAFIISSHSIRGSDIKATLTALISTAQGLANSAQVGTFPLSPGEVFQSDLDALIAVIASAQAVVDDEGATVTEVNSALETLNIAIIAYNNAIEPYKEEHKGTYTIAKAGDADYLTSHYANDTACIEAALNEVPSGSRIYVKSGTYLISKVINLGGKDMEIFGEGDVKFIFNTNQPESFEVYGSVVPGGTRYLTQDKDQGSTEIVLNNAANIRSGDLIAISNSIKWCPDDPTFYDQLTGEMYTVEKVSGNTVTITEPLIRNYLVSDSSKAKVYRPSKFHIDNIKFIQGVAGGSTLKKDGIQLNMCKESAITNCYFENFGREAIILARCFDVTVSGCTIKNCNFAGVGYGIGLMNACTAIRITDNLIENCRHCIASSSVERDDGLNRGIVITNNVLVGASIKDSNVIDAHEATIDYLITNNIIYVHTVDNNQYAAFADGTQQSTFSNNYVYGGVAVRHRYGKVPGGIHVIANNRIVGGAVFRGTNGVICESLTITGNEVRDSRNVGINAVSKAYKQYIFTGNNFYNIAGDGIVLSLPAIAEEPVSAVISNNIITNVGGNGINVTMESNEDILNCVISGNIIRDANQSNGNNYGIKLNNISESIISDNIISNRKGTVSAGIIENGECNYNHIHHNTISGADKPVIIVGNKTVNKDNITKIK